MGQTAVLNQLRIKTAELKDSMKSAMCEEVADGMVTSKVKNYRKRKMKIGCLKRDIFIYKPKEYTRIVRRKEGFGINQRG